MTALNHAIPVTKTSVYKEKINRNSLIFSSIVSLVKLVNCLQHSAAETSSNLGAFNFFYIWFSSRWAVLGEIMRKPSNRDLSLQVRGGVSNEKSQQVHQLLRGLRKRGRLNLGLNRNRKNKNCAISILFLAP